MRTSQRDPRKQPDRVFRYVDVSSVDNKLFKVRGVTSLKGSEAPSRARKGIRANDVLFATVRPTLKRVALIPAELDGEIASTGYCVLRPNPDKVEPAFLYSCVLTDSFIRVMGKLERGANYPAVRDSDVFAASIPIPPLPEQRKIAAVLGLVQRAMEQQERLVSLTSELKKALMHKLFTEGLHGEPQKQTEIGLVPQSWVVEGLGAYLTEAQYGVSARGSASGRYPMLRMTNQHRGRITADNLQYVELKDEQFRRFRVEKRDILFNRTNSLDLVGRTAVFELEGDFAFASYLIRLRADADRLRPLFLNHYFNWEETQVRLKSIATRAVSQSNISATRLCGFPVPVPQPDEQDEVVERIGRVERKLSVHERKRAALGDMFRTLLHQLMTGQIRVNDLDLPELDPLREGSCD